MSTEMIVGILVMIAGYIGLYLQIRKDIRDANKAHLSEAISAELRIKALEAKQINVEEKLQTIKESDYDSRMQRLELRQIATDENLRVMSTMITALQSSIDITRGMLAELQVEVRMFKDIRSTLKDFDAMLRSLSKAVAEHGIEIKNLKDNLED
jgi:uncharacterized coiled-coil protein SlyX